MVSKCLKCKIDNCHKHCVLNNNVREIIELYLKNELDFALDELLKTNPIPYITGSLCRAYCMQNCNNNKKQLNVNFQEVEYELGKRELLRTYNIKENGKKVYVVGSGPASLAAAILFRKDGYSVTIYEKLDNIGGLIYSALPSFKLNQEYQYLIRNYLNNLGIIVNCNYDVSREMIYKLSLDGLVIVGCGLEKAKTLNYTKEAEYAIDVLKKLKKDMSKINEYEDIYIYGLGNVAVDLAVLFKTNNKNIELIYHKPRELARIEKKEYDELMSHNIKINFDTRVFDFENDYIIIERNKEYSKLKSNNLIVAIGQRPADEFNNLDIVDGYSKELNAYFIGDIVESNKNVTYAISSSVSLYERIKNEKEKI